MNLNIHIGSKVLLSETKQSEEAVAESASRLLSKSYGGGMSLNTEEALELFEMNREDGKKSCW